MSCFTHPFMLPNHLLMWTLLLFTLHHLTYSLAPVITTIAARGRPTIKCGTMGPESCLHRWPIGSEDGLIKSVIAGLRDQERNPYSAKKKKYFNVHLKLNWGFNSLSSTNQEGIFKTRCRFSTKLSLYVSVPPLQQYDSVPGIFLLRLLKPHISFRWTERGLCALLSISHIGVTSGETSKDMRYDHSDQCL